MQKNLYYRSLMRRENIIKKFFLSLFDFFVSGSRLLLEVFIRKNFGERYFRLSAAIILIIEFGLLPFLLVFLQRKFGSSTQETQITDVWSDEPATVADPTADPSLWTGYIGWYAFLGLFLFFSIKHYLDKKRQPSAFDFEKFSLSSGELQSYTSRIPLFDTKNRRLRECFVEPLFFMVIGIAFLLIHQHVGWLLVICSLLYSSNYIAAYESGDNFILDIIDEQILNQEMEKDFVDGEEDDISEFRARRPVGKEYRRKLLPAIVVEDDPASDPDILVAS
ncbi:hypothetical protein [uncultured Chryseobacterium sp.]|uniref:hypothetical protein n=1 Tax=uncultured Chryseobacterium sp. TaxID=259322 RepID=UPI0025FC0B0B|nr:hypothetical protein [uncultured Chryseobacterium sp.]